MANTFNNATFNANLAANYASPALVSGASGTQTTLIGMTIANVTAGVISVGVQFVNASGIIWILKDAPIPTGSSLIPVGGDQKIVLKNGDSVKVISNTVNSVHVVSSFLEIT